jgi:hypothetical protein
MLARCNFIFEDGLNDQKHIRRKEQPDVADTIDGNVVRPMQS